MSTKRSSDNVILSMLLGERRIALAWQVKIEVFAYSVAELPTPYLQRSAVEAAMRYVEKRLPVGCSLRFRIDAPVLTTQSIFDAEHFQASLPITAHIKLSEPALTLHRIREKRCMWAVPNQIEWRGSTVTITRILDMNCYELNLFSGAAWQEVPPKISVPVRTRKPLSLTAVTPTGGHIPNGNHPF